MRNRTWRIACIAGAALLCLVVTTSALAAGTLTIRIGSDISNLDPAKFSSWRTNRSLAISIMAW